MPTRDRRTMTSEPRGPSLHGWGRRARATLGLLGIGVLIGLVGCDPDEEALRSTMPPRDPDGAELRTLTLGADRITVRPYEDRPDVAQGTRLLFGQFGGIVATTYVRFDSAAYELPDTLGPPFSEPIIQWSCIGGHGDPDGQVDVAFVAIDSAAGKWAEDSLRVGEAPLFDPSLIQVTSIDVCTDSNLVIDDPDDENGSIDASERTIDFPLAALNRWMENPVSRTGFALQVSGGEAIYAVSSAENGILGGSDGPRLRFNATGDDGAVFPRFLGQLLVAGDTWVGEDTEPLPCADPEDCFRIGRGIGYRSIMTTDVVDQLPPGTNIHRAVIRFRVLPFARFDKPFELQVFRLTEEISDGEIDPDEVETSGILWHTATASPDSATVEIPITNLVQSWFDGAFVNRGILVRSAREDADFATVVFGSPSHPDAAMRPEIEVIYSEPYGGRP